MPKINFLREKKVIEVKEGENLREAALNAGIEIYRGIHNLLNCRGKGLCATCRVLIKNDTIKNASPKGIFEKLRLAFSWVAIGEEDMRLSCKVRVKGDVDVYTQPELNLYGRKI
ncbi:MAG: (2Fe-2S)-binding protein [Candidatus Omnitrophica bacterium]|nr:(2Fe-2S)-binding protein [Candidatus Omnitrophota bacterium]